MSKEDFNPTIAAWVVRTLAVVIAWTAVIEGLIITLGSQRRLEGGMFATALKVPGAPPTWGVGILFVGLLAIAGLTLKIQRVTSCAMMAGTAWSLSLVISFVVSAFTQENSDLTGIVVYAFLALIFAILAAVYGDSAKSARHKKI